MMQGKTYTMLMLHANEKEKTMKLTIFGSTGGTGRQVTAQALKQGHDVTAFARSPEKLDQTHEKLQVAQGDVLRLPLVEQAIQGQDAVVCTLGMSAIMDTTMLRTNGAKHIICAMENTGVKRFICQSSFGVGDSRDMLPFHYKYLIVPLMLRRVFADHEMQEHFIKESSLDWIIVRPGNLTDGERTCSYQHGVALDNKTAMLKISRADTADFMLKQLTDNSYLHKTPCISY
jgi:putative NADH-flavin reductase